MDKGVFKIVLVLIFSFGMFVAGIILEYGVNFLIATIRDFLLISIPIFVIIELFSIENQIKRADESFAIQKKRGELLSILDWMKKEECANQIFEMMKIIDSEELLIIASRFIGGLTGRYYSFTCLDDIFDKEEEIINGSAKPIKKRLIKYYASIEKRDTNSLIAPFMKLYHDYLCGNLRFSHHESKMNLLAFSISFISLSIGIISCLNIGFTWASLGYAVVPIIVQTIALFCDRDNEIYWQESKLKLLIDVFAKVKKRIEKSL